MHMKSEIIKVILFISIGITFGSVFTKQSANNRLIETIDLLTEDEWISAKSHLSLATAIRNNPSKALEFTERQIVKNVNKMTDNGKSLDDLTEFEISTIYQIKEYWGEKCKKQCFQDISQVLSDDRFE